jgi:glycosyltransferase involved in cell wall biosynthesis
MTGKPRDQGRSILIEGHNLTLATGTGIATYARNLGETARELGYTTEVLVSALRGYDRKDPVMNEVNLFDTIRKPNLGQKIMTEWRHLTVMPSKVSPFEVSRSGTVVGPSADKLAGFSKVHAVAHLDELERFHFKRYGKPLRLKMRRTPNIFHATRPAPISVQGCPNIYTIHDIVPLRLPYTTADDKKFYHGMIRDLCKRADHIVTVSDFSRQDIMKLTGIEESRITNTYQSVQLPENLVSRNEASVARDLETLFGLGLQEYYLFIGALEPKKNVSRLIDAHAASGVKYPLVIAGAPGWLSEGDIEKIESERFLSYEINGSTITPRRSVRQLEYLPFNQLVSLMRGARALLFPSVYEGFGLPVLEAMSLGTPVMTSNVSSLPEIAGDAAVLVDPYDIDAMAQAIRMIDQDADLRKSLRQQGIIQARKFSPERYAARMADLYNKLA